MPGIDFDDLPFNQRPDLSPYIIHLTKNSQKVDENSAFDNLVSILQTGKILGSGFSGRIKAGNKATCFMDVPFAALKYVLNPRDSDPENSRYEAYGLIVNKKYAYKKAVGLCVIYLLTK